MSKEIFFDIEEVGTRLKDVDKLSDELKKQLQIFNINNQKKKILEVFKEYNGFANIDEIMVGHYKKYNIIFQRPILTNILYRMSLNGLLKKVKGKKGIYILKSNYKKK